MCESNVYLLKKGKEEKLLEDVELIRCQDGQLFLSNINGETREIKGKIISIDFENHKVLIREAERK
jgi:predicted RNA-binding protein